MLAKDYLLRFLFIKNEIICLFKGEILTTKEAAYRAKNKLDGYFINMLNGSIMDSKNTKCFAKYANDTQGVNKSGLQNNSIISINERGLVCLIATRKIKIGEEIFCSYGKKYWAKYQK